MVHLLLSGVDNGVQPQAIFFAMLLAGPPSVILAQSWLLSIGVNSAATKTGRVEVAVGPCLVSAYLLILSLTLPILVFIPELISSGSSLLGFIVVLISIAVSAIYCMVFAARSLVSAEMKEVASFNHYLPTLLQIPGYPMSVFFIQPRLRAVMACE